MTSGEDIPAGDEDLVFNDDFRTLVSAAERHASLVSSRPEALELVNTKYTRKQAKTIYVGKGGSKKPGSPAN